MNSWVYTRLLLVLAELVIKNRLDEKMCIFPELTGGFRKGENDENRTNRRFAFMGHSYLGYNCY